MPITQHEVSVQARKVREHVRMAVSAFALGHVNTAYSEAEKAEHEAKELKMMFAINPENYPKEML